LPRRYRPPVKRRKTKKQSPSDILAQPLAPEEVVAPVVAPRAAVSTAAPPASRSETRHVARDYSYVRGEIMRIAIVAGFIMVSLVLTAVLLR
jgi:hypothetical protein